MSAQEVRSRIIDVNGGRNHDDGLEVRESALSAMSVYEAKGLDGELYIASHYEAMAVNGSVDFRLLSTLSRKIKFNIDARDNRLRMRVSRRPTLTASGAVMNAWPPNFVGDANAVAGVGNMATNFVWLNPTVGALGTVFFDGLAGAVQDYLLTLEALEEYLVSFDNMSGVINIVGINIGTFI